MARWTVPQLMTMRLLAIGLTQDAAAARANVDRVTLWKWRKRPEFDAMVEQLRERAFAMVETDIWGNLRLALDLQRQMFAGEIAPDDPRLPGANQLLNRFLDKLSAVPAELPAGAPATQPYVAVQVNTNGYHANGVHPSTAPNGYIEQGPAIGPD